MKRQLTMAAAVGVVAVGVLWTFGRGDVATGPTGTQIQLTMQEPEFRLQSQADERSAFDVLAESIRVEAMDAQPVSQRRSPRGNEIHLIAMSAGRDRWHPADWSHDGVLDERDLELFIEAFRRGCSSADLTGDGMLSIDDVHAFIQLMSSDWQPIFAGC